MVTTTLVGQIKIVSSADNSGLKETDKELLKLQKDADKLAEEIDKLGDVSAEVSAEKIARFKVALADIEKQAKESGGAIQGLEKAEKALSSATDKVTRQKVEAGKIQRQLDRDIAQSRGGLNQLFSQGASSAERLANGVGMAGAAFAGGFATGLKIAEKAGVDTTEMMRELDKLLASSSKGVNDLVASILDWDDAQGQLDAKYKATPGRVVSMLEAAKALGVELKGNEEKVRRYQQVMQSGVDKSADPKVIEKKNAALEESVRIRKMELSILGETPARIEAVRSAELAYAASQEGGAAKVAALKQQYHLEDIARAKKLADTEKAEADRAAQARFDAKQRIEANNAAVEASIQATTKATFDAEVAAAEDAAVRRHQAKLRIEANDKAVNEAIAESARNRTQAEVNWEKIGAQQKADTVAAGASAMFGVATQAFGDKKEFAIAQAMINTYESATGAYNALAPIPIVGPALGASAAALAVVAGLKNVKMIASAKPPSGGKGAAKAPSFDDPQNDAAALYAGAASARDVAGHFGNGFRKQLLSGTAHLAAGNTAPAMMDSFGSGGGGMTVIVEKAYGSVDEPFLRKLTRDQRKYNAVKESRMVQKRDRVRR